MVKYNWSILDLENRLEIFKRLYYRNKDELFREDVLRDISLLESQIQTYYTNNYNTISLLDKYKNVKEDLENLSFMMDIINDFHDITQNKEIKVPDLKNISLSNDDLIDIATNFYQDLNHPFYGNFMKIYRQRKNHINFINNQTKKNKLGDTLYLSTTEEVFISILKRYTIEDEFTLIHECEHGISNLMNHDFCKYSLGEIDANTIEMLFADYYYKSTLNSDAIYTEAKTFNSFSYAARIISYLNKLIKKEKELNHEFTKNKELKYYAKMINEIDAYNIDNYLNMYSSDMLMGLIGYILAIELYYKFLEDKELGKFYLKKIINLDGSTNLQYYNNIKKFGFIPNFSVNNFYNNLNNKTTKLARGRKKC